VVSCTSSRGQRLQSLQTPLPTVAMLTTPFSYQTQYIPMRLEVALPVRIAHRLTVALILTPLDSIAPLTALTVFHLFTSIVRL